MIVWMLVVAAALLASAAPTVAGMSGEAAGAAAPAPHAVSLGLESSLLNRLIELEREPGSLCRRADRTSVRMQIDNLAAGLRSRIGTLRGAEAVRSLNRFVFEDLGVRPSRDLRDPANLCISTVLSRREGYCVGIASLYVVLAEAAGLPIQAVATPSHVFLRYDDGQTRINIETFRSGTEVSDADYIRDERIPARSIARGVFLRALSEEGLLAQIHNNLGVIYSERGERDRAIEEYTRATDLDPKFPAAWYNWGSDVLRIGEDRKAIKLFNRAVDLHPNDVWALNNRGVAYRKLGKTKRARRDFEDALRIDPEFAQAKDNLATLGAR
jgi:regulator of sirC expression with transglutaminase-like and TPR domain